MNLTWNFEQNLVSIWEIWFLHGGYVQSYEQFQRFFLSEYNIWSRYSWTYTGVVFVGIVVLYCVVLMSNMVGVKNKWNDMVECGGIVAASEQWVRLVMYEGRRTEA